MPSDGPVEKSSSARWRRRLQALAAEALASVRWAKFAGTQGLTKRSLTLALEAEGIDEYAARVHPLIVDTADGLLASPNGVPRLWLPRSPAPAPETARIVTIKDRKQPWFAATPPAARPTQQAFLRLSNAIVYPRPGVVMSAPGRVIRGSQLRWVPDHRLMPGFIDFVAGRLVARGASLRPTAMMRRPLLALCHPFYRNYGHWLFDCLPFVLPWKEALGRGHLSLLVAPLAEWQRRTLALLGVPNSAICETEGQSVLCSDIVVAMLRPTEADPATQPPSFRLPQPSKHVVEVVETLRSSIARMPATDAPERIYVSRRGIKSFRHMRNEEEIEAIMARLGFAIVRPQELEFDRQVAIFSRARVVVGPHGAGMTNAAFARAGCLVLDIFPEVWSSSRWVVRMALLFGHYYLPVTFPMDGATPQHVSFDNADIGSPQFFTVDGASLCSILRRAMRDLGLETAEISDS